MNSEIATTVLGKNFNPNIYRNKQYVFFVGLNSLNWKGLSCMKVIIPSVINDQLRQWNLTSQKTLVLHERPQRFLFSKGKLLQLLLYRELHKSEVYKKDDCDNHCDHFRLLSDLILKRQERLSLRMSCLILIISRFKVRWKQEIATEARVIVRG